MGFVAYQIGSTLMAEISVEFIVSGSEKVAAKTTWDFFLIDQKKCFMTLVFAGGIPEVGARCRIKLRPVFFI